mmetsp:Transcript_58772/g.140077  ORF Transcript_58772/g.140077 Transcript_58772/m.140077 type:complete len:334 (+) Transcript_58772:73-1074(+)
MVVPYAVHLEGESGDIPEAGRGDRAARFLPHEVGFGPNPLRQQRQQQRASTTQSMRVRLGLWRMKLCRRRVAFRVLAALLLVTSVCAGWRPMLQNMRETFEQRNAGLHVDSDVLDLLAKRVFVAQRESFTEELMRHIEAARDVVTDSVFDLTGVSLELQSLSLSLLHPWMHVTKASLPEGPEGSHSSMDLEVQVRIGFAVDSSCHIDIPVKAVNPHFLPRACHAVLRTTASAFIPAQGCDGSCSHQLDLDARIQGSLEGPVKFRVELGSHKKLPLPAVEKLSLLDASHLTVKLSHYRLSPDKGLVGWIRRLNLLPLGLLERIANTELRKAVLA